MKKKQIKKNIRIVVQTGHSGKVFSVAFSPDGKLLASGSFDRTVKLWDAQTGTELTTLTGHFGIVNSVAFSPDGKMIASGSNDDTIRLWDVVSGKELKVIQNDNDVETVSFSPDGKMIASPIPTKYDCGTCLGAEIKLWDISSGTVIKTLKSHACDINTLAFSPTAEILASGSDDKTIKLWDVASGTELKKIENLSEVNSLAFDSDGNVLVSGSSDGAIRLWDVDSGKELITLMQPDSTRVNTVDISFDGKLLASAGRYEALKLWHIASGAELKVLTNEYSREELKSIAFIPELKFLTDYCEEDVYSVAFSPDGKTLASGTSDKKVTFWNIASGMDLKACKVSCGSISKISWSSDGEILASITEEGEEGIVKLWDLSLKSKTKLRSLKLSSDCWSMAFSPVGKILGTGCEDGTVKLFDAGSGIELRTLTGFSVAIESVVFSPDGKILACEASGAIKLWEVSSGKELNTLSESTGGGESTIAFSPDGKILVSGSFDESIKVWDITTGKKLKTFPGHMWEVGSIAISPIGKILASVGPDEKVKLWDLAKGIQLKTMTGHSEAVWAVDFSPDGKTLATGSYDQTVKLWDVATGKLRETLESAKPNTKYRIAKSFPRLFRDHYKGDVSDNLAAEIIENVKIKLSDRRTGREIATLVAFGEKDWLITTPENFFDGTSSASQRIIWKFDDNVSGFAQSEAFFKEYYRPDLLKNLLS